jgi:hypothetical protein
MRSFCRWGNSLGLRLSKPLAEALKGAMVLKFSSGWMFPRGSPG